MRLKKSVKYGLLAILIICIIGIIILMKQSKTSVTNASTKEDNVQVSDSSNDNQPQTEDTEIETNEEDTGLQVVEEIQLDSGDPEKTEEIGG